MPQSYPALLSATALATILLAAPALARPLQPADLFHQPELTDPQLSPDGREAAYVLSLPNTTQDSAEPHIWAVPLAGGAPRQLTGRPGESEASPSYSPDGSTLAFLTTRNDPAGNAQIWLLPRAGGEARKLTDLPAGVDSFTFAPDGKSIALIAPDAPEGAQGAHLPIVIDRYQFKADVEGLLTARHHHLYLATLDGAKPRRLTDGDYDEALPAFSPDGSALAFVSKRMAEADRSYHFVLYRIELAGGAKSKLPAPKALTTYAGDNNDAEWSSPPAWSPDGKRIAYLQGGPTKLIAYATHQLAIIPSAGGTPVLPAPSLDRNVDSPAWSADGTSITLRKEDDGNVNLIQIDLAKGSITQLDPGPDVVRGFATGRGHTIAALGTQTHPEELAELTPTGPRYLTQHSAAFLAGIDLATTQDWQATSPDGTVVHGFLTCPRNTGNHAPTPTILRLHGGPQLQFEREFRADWQILAGHGYCVVAMNPRGSSGRGTAYSAAIYADWGHVDVMDVQAGLDRAIAMHIADPARLGVGGWSYGGMLTNYVIASTQRFRAAISGASISNILAGYGTDQYIRDYETELGRPWDNLATWEKISYPFLHANRITTPTLFMGGDRDFNVPLQNGEQMYQALRSLGIPTELVIYPGEFHDFTRPSFLVDRLTRYLAWYDRYLKNQK